MVGFQDTHLPRVYIPPLDAPEILHEEQIVIKVFLSSMYPDLRDVRREIREFIDQTGKGHKKCVVATSLEESPRADWANRPHADECYARMKYVHIYVGMFKAKRAKRTKDVESFIRTRDEFEKAGQLELCKIAASLKADRASRHNWIERMKEAANKLPFPVNYLSFGVDVVSVILQRREAASDVEKDLEGYLNRGSIDSIVRGGRNSLGRKVCTCLFDKCEQMGELVWVQVPVRYRLFNENEDYWTDLKEGIAADCEDYATKEVGPQNIWLLLVHLHDNGDYTLVPVLLPRKVDTRCLMRMSGKWLEDGVDAWPVEQLEESEAIPGLHIPVVVVRGNSGKTFVLGLRDIEKKTLDRLTQEIRVKYAEVERIQFLGMPHYIVVNMMATGEDVTFLVFKDYGVERDVIFAERKVLFEQGTLPKAAQRLRRSLLEPALWLLHMYYIIQENLTVEVPELVKRAFVCYDYEHDQHLKDKLVQQSQRKGSILPIVRLHYSDEGWSESEMQAKIDKVDFVVVLLGDQTYRDANVRQEIAIAKKRSKRVVCLDGRKDKSSPIVEGCDELLPWTLGSITRLFGGGR